MTTGIEKNLKKWPAKVAIALFLISALPLYPLYYILRFPICIILVYYLFNLYKKEGGQESEFWWLLGILVLFNPILPLHLFFAPLWIISDLLCAFYLFHFLKKL
jgi:hypothetical protein